MGLLVSGIIGFGTALLFAAILFWLDRYEKEPLLLLGGVFLWGAIFAAGSAFLVNTVLGLGIFVFTESAAAADLATGSLVAPFVEECLKGLAVLVVFLFFRREFDSVLDGIVYAGVTALGFAATENTFYIYNYGYLENGWRGLIDLSFVRIVLVGWQHPFYTAFFGIGLALARGSRNWLLKLTAPLVGLAMSIFTHAFHNTAAALAGDGLGLLLGTLLDWTGWLFMLAVIAWAIWKEGQDVRKYLAAEVKNGSLSPALYQTAGSAWRQGAARFTALFNGRYIKTVRFYQLCGEYAHKCRQLETVGDEAGNLALVKALRSELSHLAPLVQA